MARCGSQCFLCDLPIRFDTYNGCSHACEYCFAKKFVDISKIKKDETAKNLRNFIEGRRGPEVCWCDWDIPIHWGGMSDPFQPVEKKIRNSYECLKVFAETQYPFVVSTKGKLIIEDDYLDLISKCNCVVQISVVCASYDKMETGAPSFEERLHMASVLSKKVKRVIVRIQPYMHEVFDEVYNNLERFKKAGVYGVIVEGMKFKKMKPGLVKVNGDYTYPYQLIKADFLKLREKAHSLGLKIYSGENRTRIYGDSLTCCGIDGLEGFIPNKFNLNHLCNGDKQEPTEKMKEENTGLAFKTLSMDTPNTRRLGKNSFAFNMIDLYKNRRDLVEDTFGIKERK